MLTFSNNTLTGLNVHCKQYLHTVKRLRGDCWIEMNTFLVSQQFLCVVMHLCVWERDYRGSQRVHAGHAAINGSSCVVAILCFRRESLFVNNNNNSTLQRKHLFVVFAPTAQLLRDYTILTRQEKARFISNSWHLFSEVSKRPYHSDKIIRILVPQVTRN